MSDSNYKKQAFYQIRKDTDCTETIKCPACKTDMLKIYIPQVGFNIDLCVDGCGGIFFDNREFEKINVPDNDIESVLNLLKDKTFTPVNKNAVRVCPACKTKMLKNIASKARVEIDTCPVCGGKFLDNTEFDVIRESFFGKYEQSIIEFALRNQQSFAAICSEIIKQSERRN